MVPLWRIFDARLLAFVCSADRITRNPQSFVARPILHFWVTPDPTRRS
jgi:hypothetical protein